MAVRHATAYALRSRPLGEADLIVEMFSVERGRIRVVARSARRPRSRFGSSLEPFTRSQVVYFQRDKDDLGRLSSCEIERSYFEVLASLERAPLAGYMAELIIGLTPEHDPAPTLFRLVGAVLDALAGGAPTELIARYFEVWILRLSGLLPDLHHCGQCDRPLQGDVWVSEVTQSFLCARQCGDTAGSVRLGAPARALLLAILANPPEQIGSGTVSVAAVRSLEQATVLLIRSHLDRMPRSLRLMRKLRDLC